MSKAKLKSEIIFLLDHVESEERLEEIKRFLEFLSANESEILSGNVEEPIIGYEPNGIPITLSRLRTEIKERSESVKKGDFLSHEQTENESESW